MIDGTLLSNIAQGIRNVDGTNAKLTPAQMQAKLDTIKTSVGGALNQVKKKGVTVPSGSDVHDLASLIAKIKTSPSLMSKFTYGTYTPTSNKTDVTITHDLGVEPDFFMLTSENGKLTVGNGQSVRPILMDFMYSNHLYYGDYKYALAGGTYSSTNKFKEDLPTVTTSTIQVYVYLPTSGNAKQAACLKSGEKYYWIAGVWA